MLPNRNAQSGHRVSIGGWCAGAASKSFFEVPTERYAAAVNVVGLHPLPFQWLFSAWRSLRWLFGRPVDSAHGGIDAVERTDGCVLGHLMQPSRAGECYELPVVDFLFLKRREILQALEWMFKAGER